MVNLKGCHKKGTPQTKTKTKPELELELQQAAGGTQCMSIVNSGVVAKTAKMLSANVVCQVY